MNWLLGSFPRVLRSHSCALPMEVGLRRRCRVGGLQSFRRCFTSDDDGRAMHGEDMAESKEEGERIELSHDEIEALRATPLQDIEFTPEELAFLASGGSAKKLSSLPRLRALLYSDAPVSIPRSKSHVANAFFNNAKTAFVRSCVDNSSLPTGDVPEVGFIGRSNVGKSTLMNELLGGRKQLVRSSSTPGHTQSLNYFALSHGGKATPSMYMVDMPGYGYTTAPPSVKQQWVRLMKEFVLARPILRRTFILIDSRRGIGSQDVEYLDEMLEYGVSSQVVLTKSDKVSKSALKEVEEDTLQRLKAYPMCLPWVITTSASKKEGISDLKLAIAMSVGAVES